MLQLGELEKLRRHSCEVDIVENGYLGQLGEVGEAGRQGGDESTDHRKYGDRWRTGVLTEGFRYGIDWPVCYLKFEEARSIESREGGHEEGTFEDIKLDACGQILR